MDDKLNESSLMLESSKMMGAGVRVPVKFSSVLKTRGFAPGTASISFFPGAMAAFRGINSTGEWFQVSEVLAVSSFFILAPSNRPHAQ